MNLVGCLVLEIVGSFIDLFNWCGEGDLSVFDCFWDIVFEMVNVVCEFLMMSFCCC